MRDEVERTMSQTSHDDDSLEPGLLLVGPDRWRPAMVPCRIIVGISPLPLDSGCVQNPSQRDEHSQSSPHPLLLLMTNNLMLESPKGSDLACGRRRAPELRQDGRGSRASHCGGQRVCRGRLRYSCEGRNSETGFRHQDNGESARRIGLAGRSFKNVRIRRREHHAAVLCIGAGMLSSRSSRNSCS